MDGKNTLLSCPNYILLNGEFSLQKYKAIFSYMSHAESVLKYHFYGCISICPSILFMYYSMFQMYIMSSVGVHAYNNVQ